MNNKQLFVVTFYLVFLGLFGFACGYYSGTQKQSKINESLQTEYDELKTNYDILEIQYKRDLESCYQQLGDMQDRYDLGQACYVDGGLNCE